MELERIILDSRTAGHDELTRICNELSEKLSFLPDSAESLMYYLRHIYQLTSLTKRRRVRDELRGHLLKSLVTIVGLFVPPSTGTGYKPTTLKVKGQSLALLVLKDLLPVSFDTLDEARYFFVGVLKESQSSLLLEASLFLLGPTAEPSLASCIIEGAKLKSTRSFSRAALFLLPALVRSNQAALTAQDTGEISARISNALISSQTAVSTATKTVIVGRRQEVVTELDGTPLRDAFTVLNLCRSYSKDQILNICCFSVLKMWLLHTRLASGMYNEFSDDILKGQCQFIQGSPLARVIGNSQFFDNASSTDSGSLDTASLSSSINSLHSFMYLDDSSVGLDISQRDTSVESQNIFRANSISLSHSSPSESSKFARGHLRSFSLDLACLKYCKRVLAQFERVPKQAESVEMAKAACVEAVSILNMLAKESDDNVQQVFSELKRLHARLCGNPMQNREVFVAVLQFFITNHESITYDIEGSVLLYLQETPSFLYHDSFACFELIDFIVNNKSYFATRNSLLQKCYPSILKVIAWHPRTFLKEFIDLLPLLISKTNASEVLHSLLDLPCLSLVLELVRERKISDSGELNVPWAAKESPEFPAVNQEAVLKFLLRKESLDKYPKDDMMPFFQALSEHLTRARIAVACQIVPVLLEVFFDSVLLLEDPDREIFLSLCERLFKLLPIHNFQEEVRKILSRRAKDLCASQPILLSNSQDEVVNTVYSAKRGGASADFVLSNFFDMIGRFGSRDSICCPEEIHLYYELLEAFVYEVVPVFSGPVDFPFSGKLISTLLASTAKLSASAKEYVPRTVLCLSKVMSHPYNVYGSPLLKGEYRAIIERCQELLGVLRMPNVAQSILCSRDSQQAWHLDRNTSVLLKVHAISRQTGKTDNEAQ